MVNSFSKGLACLAIAAAPAHAQVTCEGMPASVAGLPTLEARIAAAKNSALVKDEFETTAAFRARAAAASAGLPTDPVAIVLPAKTTIEFDADTSTVKVSSYALDPLCWVYEHTMSDEAKALAFGPQPRSIGGLTLSGKPYCLTASVSRASGAPFAASNAYGAKVQVTPVTERRVGFFFGFGDIGLQLVDAKLDRTTYKRAPAFEFQATVDEARSLKDNAAIAVLLKVSPPYYVKGSYLISAKIDSPTEVMIQSDMLAGSPSCFALVDGKTGKVFSSRAAKPTKDY